MKTTIITGGSKGLGKSLVEIYCNKGFQVISIARSESGIQHPNLSQIQADLSDATGLKNLMDEVFAKIDLNTLERIELINNAGTLGEITKLENCTPGSIIKTMELNLTSPMVLSGLFVKKLKGHHAAQRVVNISSGAAVKAYFGWSNYCTSKAGLDMLTKSMALEQADNKNFKSISIYPGIIDTDMQAQIRNTQKEDFVDLELFISFKKDGLLATPEEAAERVYSITQQDAFKSGTLLDVLSAN